MEGKIVVIKHVEKEGPGLIESIFKGDGLELETIELSAGEELPESLENVAAVIMLGGPMNVYEEDAYPFLKDEDRFIRKVIVEEIPFLGICLGSQLLSKACAGRVDKSPVKEVGWYTVELTRDGQKDLLFQGLPKTFKAFQWHEDTFEIPEGGMLLAKARGCKNQAFKIGNNAYGLQFHIEVTEGMVGEWLKDEEGKIDTGKILSDTKKMKESFEKLACDIFLNFKRVIESSLRIRKIIKLFVEDEKNSRKKKTLLWWNNKEHAFISGKV
jgi:GMP synthase-like glutamine amidotransferase